MINEYTAGRVFAGGLSFESDICEELTNFCSEKNIKNGHITLIGAVTSFKTGYFDIAKQQYIVLEEASEQKPFEIASCSGNISLKDSKPFVHLHVVFADRNGACKGGHLMAAKIYAAEFVIQEFSGPDLVRAFDKQTGLHLWAAER